MADLLLQVKDMSKTFPGVKALDHVNLQIGYGEVHGLIGENGAGKSTIIKIIAGIYEPDEGQVTFMGKTCQHESIRQSLSRGISVIYQELCLVPHMKVYENIMLGYEGLKHGGYSAEKAVPVRPPFWSSWVWNFPWTPTYAIWTLVFSR